MKFESIERIQTTLPIAVLDFDVKDGYRQGPGGQLPDVDCDFQSDRRQEVKEYIEKRYNNQDGKYKQRVFSAGTYTTLKLKAVLKDVCRVHRVPLNLVNYITAIFEEDNMSWTDLFLLAAKNKKVRKFILDYPEAIEDARGIMGQPRSASVHASALVITPAQKDGEEMECFDYTPIKKIDDILVSELDGYSIDEVGLLKNDCLGIKELTKLRAAIDECNRVYNAGISFEGLVRSGLDDLRTYKLLSEGHTQNIFQFSSRGMTKFLMDMQPSDINDLIAANALYRPATLSSGSVQKYLDCKRGEVAPIYLWGTYNALHTTYGVLVYQEQLAQMAREVGGFSLADGVKLVKLISKKKIDMIHAMKEKFMDGAKDKGCPKEDAELIWEMIEAGGSYLFNKSHATAYAVTSYLGAWLKANYPTVFFNVALQWADDKEIPMLMSEMEKCSNATISAPDINTSSNIFFTDYQTNEIFWSLNKIKMLGEKAVNCIINEREKGTFTSIENFIHRIFRYKLKKYQYWDEPDNAEEATRVPVNARHVRNLIIAGCFDRIENVKSVVERFAILKRAAKELGFTLQDSDFPEGLINKHYFWSVQQIKVSGIGSIDYQRIYDNSEVKKQIRGKASYMALKNALETDNEGKRIAVCATVIEQDEISYKDKQTGENKQFCKLKLQQNNDLIELVLWNDFYQEHKTDIKNLKDKMIIVTAIVRYSDYTGANSLNTFKTSILCSV
ncbi:DNA polymerase III subunit alpha [Bacteroides uniformis]|uniref:helix-hairpin-helix domain-containing protein n=1 Tax=Bacteroides uniformis TaxID=820 RepID=UPI00233F5CBB|nr:DNA polymerase III subunit alpha [Bacteroides uniformis]MDC1812105.1 DNA polymerase III subunit alpha [Bacteroides uniformis]